MLQFPEHRGRQLLQGHTLQEQSFLLGEFLFLSNPPYEILVYWTDYLAIHTSNHAVMPGSSHPIWKWDVTPFLIVKNNASLTSQKETI